ncbi:EAL domain-containing protein [Pseudomonas sp. GCM10022188]|uniref:EAL domain-containing response regulator n=1 Tax=Pseudomonas TaxID=286 RepID=UPI001E3CD3DB|nr:EAL domain-containing protein [Pseudomonas oryzagri]MCC6076440.1 EAL domain-containing protein [Pseudomonas oryzagri]
MPSEKKTVRLLLLEDSQNEAERLINLFRNAGHATRAHRLTSDDDLAEALNQVWDLLIAAPQSENLEPADALNAIRRQGKDLPFLQLLTSNDSEAVTEALLLGAQDALPQGDDERLMLVAERELRNLEERRGRRTAEMALREAEKRCQLLLDSSVDAITYVHDGMHIYVNRAYVELFGYHDADDIAGMPMIDLIQGSDQTAFKDFLKTYQHSSEAAELQCGGVREDGSQFRARMTFSPATYDGEPCTQVVIRVENDNAELEEKLREISSQDLVTGLFNRVHFLELLDQAVERAVKNSAPATLALLRIDRYANLIGEIGLADSDLLLADCAQLLRQHFGAGAQLARFADDSFAVLLAGPTAPSEEALRSLLKKVEGHLFEIAGRTVQITLSIGATGLDERTAQASVVVERAHRCAEQVGNGNALKLYDPAEELAAAASRGNLVAIVQQALDGNGFQLLFQPIISLHGDEREHYEVQLRLNNPQGEPVPAADFFAAAQQAGLAARVDRWLLLNAIRQLGEHRAKGRNTRLFVPLNAASLQDPALLPWLSAALKAARLPADALILQLSEPDAVAYLKQAKALSQGLGELHCKVALSQFGVALNPFNTLRHLHVDFVKIDQQLLAQLNEPEHQENLKSLIAGLHAQAKLTIVPGVDNPSVLTTLWQTGVNYVQGLYLQGPSPRMDYEFSSGEE